MNYCQDGLLAYFETEKQEYDCSGYDECYGHYEIQPHLVNGRPYFKKRNPKSNFESFCLSLFL